MPPFHHIVLFQPPFPQLTDEFVCLCRGELAKSCLRVVRNIELGEMGHKVGLVHLYTS
jgi:hypothetical protein